MGIYERESERRSGYDKKQRKQREKALSGGTRTYREGGSAKIGKRKPKVASSGEA